MAPSNDALTNTSSVAICEPRPCAAYTTGTSTQMAAHGSKHVALWWAS